MRAGRTELICTVGDTAVERKMFPPDGLCHYLYYTHVFVATIVDDRPVTSHYVRATRITASFDAFKDALKRYKKTEGGLSFDIKKANEDHNIVKSGREREPCVKKVAADTVVIVNQAFKELQGKDKRKRTVVAISAILYDDDGKWNALKDAIKTATQEKSNIDTVIIISSFNSWLADMKDCKSVPPNIIDGVSGFPYLAQNMEVVNKANEAVYGKQDVVVGLSLEMGAMMYTYHSAQNDPLRSYAFKECKTATLMPLDMACSSKEREKVMDVNVAFGEGTKEVVLFFDDSATLKEKIEYVKETQLRRNFAWLYFDVHMTDFRNQCGFKNPFQLIQTLRSEFEIKDKPEPT
ncbi:hypothetical protein HPB51_007256 [Rhipicephalus microplus]|uniref:Uncharacterized protein n=1 Tax=Rhipicephalus microplus TaxID=6941 RepID=A0A9J6E0E5_RHIMP|nr:hypothetical protein HPB51_007256 [Rhipicephalus microplus]